MSAHRKTEREITAKRGTVILHDVTENSIQ
jgi:hypothetical protein